MRFAPILLFSLLLSATTSPAHDKGSAEAPAGNPTALELVLPGKPSVRIDASTLAPLERRSATAAAHDQPSALWEGVDLVDVLRQAGAPLDKQLRGRELAKVVKVTASDGYQVVFSLTELDAAFSATTVLLVDKQDGHALGADGPYRLIVPNDKRPARWVRNVIRIELIDIAAPISTH